MRISSVVAIFWGLSASVASSGEAVSISHLSIEVQSACALDNGSGGSDFGSFYFGSFFDVGSSIESVSAPGAGSIGIICSPDLPYRIEIDFGTNVSSSSQRQLRNLTTDEVIVYELFQDANMLKSWTPTEAKTGVGSGNFEWIAIYGRVPAQNIVPSAGEYRDQLLVTLIF